MRLRRLAIEMPYHRWLRCRPYLVACCDGSASPEKRRLLQPRAIGIVSEHDAPTLHAIDHIARHGGPQRRAAPAPAQSTGGSGGFGADIRGAVNDDGPFERTVVARFKASQPQRVAILPRIRVLGDEQTKARLMAVGVIGKMRREVLPASRSMRDKLL